MTAASIKEGENQEKRLGQTHDHPQVAEIHSHIQPERNLICTGLELTATALILITHPATIGKAAILCAGFGNVCHHHVTSQIRSFVEI